MPDTPTPAPALTDEQTVCAWCPSSARGNAWHNDGLLHPSCGQIDHGQGWVPYDIAAVIARAKREAAEEIAQAIDRLHDTVYQARRVPELDPIRVDTACQAYRDGAAIARRIGATR